MSDWGAKHLLAAALALVIGMVVGGLGQRPRLEALRQQVEALEARKCGGTSATNLFRGRTWEPDRPPAPGRPGPDEVTEVRDGQPVRGPAVDEPLTDAPANQPADPAPGLDPDSTEQIKDVLRLRRTQATAALREQADATDDQMQEVDGIVDRMNEELADVAATYIAAVEGGAMSRRDMMMIAADTLDVLIDAEDSLYETFSEDQREGLSDDVLDPTSYVDGSVIDRFAELELR